MRLKATKHMLEFSAQLTTYGMDQACYTTTNRHHSCCFIWFLMSFTEFIAGFLGTSAIEIVASISGFLCLFLLIQRNIWCWFFGFIQVTLYSWIFFHVKLYSDALLHIVYMGFQVYGWWNWRHHSDATQHVIIESMSARVLSFWIMIGLTAAAVLGTLMHTYTDASMPYPDAFTTCFSLIAQWLLTRRYLVNWLLWIAVDIVAIYVYLQKGLYPTAALYATFLVMCLIGYRAWKAQLQQRPIVNQT